MGEQRRAKMVLVERGVPCRDEGYGFFVFGRFGRWMAPAEVLRVLGA